MLALPGTRCAAPAVLGDLDGCPRETPGHSGTASASFSAGQGHPKSEERTARCIQIRSGSSFGSLSFGPQPVPVRARSLGGAGPALSLHPQDVIAALASLSRERVVGAEQPQPQTRSGLGRAQTELTSRSGLAQLAGPAGADSSSGPGLRLETGLLPFVYGGRNTPSRSLLMPGPSGQP